jgi:hypothetical protein
MAARMQVRRFRQGNQVKGVLVIFDNVVCYTCRVCDHNWGVLESLNMDPSLQSCFNCDSGDLSFTVKDISEIADDLIVEIGHPVITG